MSFIDTTHQLEQILVSIVKELPKVGKGNKSAAQRVRVGTLKLEKMGKQFRKESVFAEKASLSKKKTKKRKR